MSTRKLLTAYSLEGKVVLITGRTRRIGLASVRLLAQGPVIVVGWGEKAKLCEQVAKALHIGGSRRPVDHAASESSFRATPLCRVIVTTNGRIDVLVCNAGVIPAWGQTQQPATMTRSVQ